MIKKVESTEVCEPSSVCKRNLASIQAYRCGDTFRDQTFRSLKNWKTIFHMSCWKAIYAHDWNKLLYLLKKCQQWEYGFDNVLYARVSVVYMQNI